MWVAEPIWVFRALLIICIHCFRLPDYGASGDEVKLVTPNVQGESGVCYQRADVGTVTDNFFIFPKVDDLVFVVDYYRGGIGFVP